MTISGLNDPSLLRFECRIGDQWVAAADGGTIDVRDPATGDCIGTVPWMTPADVERAITAADNAQGSWAQKTAHDRSKILRRLYELMLAHADDLARIIVAEQGKPLSDAIGEVAYAASYFEWFAEEAKRMYGETIPSPWPDARLMVNKQPIGVFAALTPWNFPLAMIARKVAPGWAAGCAGVIRPDNETPFSALALAVLADQAGVPAGVCNVVTGDAAMTGEVLCASPLVRKLSFTGSTRVGAILLGQCAPTIKKTSMELGGNAPFIVFDNADLDAAITGAMAAKFRNAGQTCVCANRFYVQAGIYDAFCDRLSQEASMLVVAPGMEPGTEQGPLIHERALAKVEEHVADALVRGATLLTGGERHPRGGTFFCPTVLSGVDRQSLILREETFGPVAAIVKFTTEDEAVAMANDTPFGLAAYFYSKDLAQAIRVSERVEAGMIGINVGILSTAAAPFGGVKASGLGREGSRHGLDDYLELKYLCVGADSQ